MDSAASNTLRRHSKDFWPVRRGIGKHASAPAGLWIWVLRRSNSARWVEHPKYGFLSSVGQIKGSDYVTK
jgi:hypothetical protein